MKSEKGLSLTSVIVYIIGMLIVATIIGTFTIYFYNNLTNSSNKANIEYSKFNMNFLKDTKEENNKITNINNLANMIQFSNGTTYLYQDKSIYRNNVKISDNIEEFAIIYEVQNNKAVIKTLFQVDNKSYTTSYIMGKGY